MRLYSCLSVMLGMIILSLYQPSLGLCIGLFLINIFIEIVEKKNSYIQDMIRIVGIGIGAVLYKLTIANYFISQEDWRYEASQMVSTLSIQSVQVMFNNIVHYIKYMFCYIAGMGVLYRVFGVVMIGLWGFIIISYVINSNKEKMRIWKGIFLIGLPPLIVFSAFMPLLFLNTSASPSRVMLSFSAVTLLIGIFLRYFSEKSKIAATLIVIVCMLFQYFRMYAYGNALASQKEYETYMVYNIAHDIETINSNGAFEKVSFDGKMPKSRQVQMICEKYPSFNALVPVYFDNST